MANEPFVHFKLSDRSVQTICGTMLKPYPDSYLTKLVFNPSFKPTKDDQGFFWIDEDPQIFAAILNFYRHGQLILPDIFVAIRDSIIDKYLLPVNISSRVLHPLCPTRTTYVTYVRLRGVTESVSLPPSTELKRRLCTLVDPLWYDLPESNDNHFPVTVFNDQGHKYVIKSYLTLMNWLVAKGYDVERWDETKQEVDLKKVHTRTTNRAFVFLFLVSFIFFFLFLLCYFK
jgi:hypothetical protein